MEKVRTTFSRGISVYNYGDYKSFLSDFVVQQKRVKPNFSLGSWAKGLGLKSTASITRVINGDRLPGPEISHKLCNYFQFNQKEKTYFDHLVLLQKVQKDEGLSVLVMEKLKEIHPKKVFKFFDHHSFMAISNWYYFAIREMVLIKDFKEDVDWIIEKLHFKIKAKEAQQAIETLLELKFLTRDPKTGKLIQSEPNLEFGNDLASEASKRNHEVNLDNAKWALRNIDLDQREFNSVCLNISVDDIPKIKKTIRNFKKQFIANYEIRKEGDLTCQLQIQFFPYTKISTRSEK